MLGHRQEVEDRAAAVVDADDLERHPGPTERKQAADVVLERDLAVRSQVGSPLAIAAPSADDTTPSMPLAPRLASTRMRLPDVGK